MSTIKATVAAAQAKIQVSAVAVSDTPAGGSAHARTERRSSEIEIVTAKENVPNPGTASVDVIILIWIL